ncbi:MAG TPA: M28 family peptidase [Pyrinomonadaceae bacterium]|nr:M28 family peptidase [Pyrinomonadaceae bacterium]
MRKITALLVCLGFFTIPASANNSTANNSTLLPEQVVAALAQELSGETARRNLEFLARHHRMRGSRGFRAAAEHLSEQLRAYGLSDVRIEQFPADGKIFYGTQRSRPPWDADFAELWEVRGDGLVSTPTRRTPVARLASWEAMPVTLAQDSESADVTAELVDVGGGVTEKDYALKDVRGKIVLAASQPGAVARLAVEKYGALGIVSYAQNQRTAWWGENDNLVRWGHLDTFAAKPTFAFMVSLKQARELQGRMARAERVWLRAVVRAGKHAGAYDVLTATIPGADPRLKDEEIAFSCHLDHQRPGANDNASGSVAILEVARTLSKLVREGRVPPPARTIRFIWPPEIEGTHALLNARPDIAARTKAVIHMDMVGGGPETKSVFHVTRGPASLPSFVNDVAEHFGEFVNEQSARFAGGESAPFSLHSPEGGKEALLAEMAEFSSGSDHQIYTDSSWGIPAIYLNDWPDRYIHTNFDTPANVDPTKLKRAAFIGAASGYFLADMKERDAHAILALLQTQALRRTARMLTRRDSLPPAEAANLTRFHRWYERAVLASMSRFFKVPESVGATGAYFLDTLQTITGPPSPLPPTPAGDGRLVFRRNAKLKGPMSAFGYDYFTDKLGEERVRQVRLLRFEGARGSGGDYAYEVLNFVDGRRTAQEIRDAVSAVYGAVPLETVVEYLRALETIGAVESSR